MSNPLYFLVGLLIASAYPLGVEPLRFADPSRGLPAALGIVAAYAVVSTVALRLWRTQPVLVRVALRWLALALYGVLVFVFHFPLWVWSVGLEGTSVAGPIVTLLPLLALFGVLMVTATRADPVKRRALRDTLLFGFRSFAAFSLVPVVLLLALDAGLERVAWLRRAAFLVPAVGWMVALVGMLTLVTILPYLIRVAYGARSLPPGPLRERLEALCRVTGFRCRDLLVFHTGGTRLANAFIVGALAPVRFVFFTDAILEGMSAETLECVLAHEIAHSRRRHLQSFLGSMIGFGFVNAAGFEALEGAGVPQAVAILVLVGWTAFFWVGLFGFVSRRFESEADLAAARWAPAGTQGMMEALSRVADLNRIPTWVGGWRHFSIDKRINLLWKAYQRPLLGEAFERRCARFRWGAAAFFLLGLILVGSLGFRQVSKTGEREALYGAYGQAEKGEELLRAGRHAEALAMLQAAIQGGADGGQEWLWVADCERALGREGAARKAESEAVKKGLTDPRDRLRLVH